MACNSQGVFLSSSTVALNPKFGHFELLKPRFVSLKMENPKPSSHRENGDLPRFGGLPPTF
jgi:hypothetical protein